MTINIGHIPQSESRSGAEEWTVESALRIYMESGIHGLVALHNASIAAGRGKTQQKRDASDQSLPQPRPAARPGINRG